MAVRGWLGLACQVWANPSGSVVIGGSAACIVYRRQRPLNGMLKERDACVFQDHFSCSSSSSSSSSSSLSSKYEG